MVGCCTFMTLPPCMYVSVVPPPTGTSTLIDQKRRACVRAQTETTGRSHREDKACIGVLVGAKMFATTASSFGTLHRRAHNRLVEPEGAAKQQDASAKRALRWSSSRPGTPPAASRCRRTSWPFLRTWPPTGPVRSLGPVPCAQSGQLSHQSAEACGC